MSDLDLKIGIDVEAGAATGKIKALIELLKNMAKSGVDGNTKAQIESTITALSRFETELEQVVNAEKKVEGQTKKTADGMDDLVSQAKIANLQSLADAFEGISSKVFGLAKSVIDSAARFEKLNMQMLTAAQGNQELADSMMAWAEEFAKTTPFQLEEITSATIKLQSYGLEAKNVLGAIGDLAAGFGKDLNSAIEAVADAQTGELERLEEFGITKKMLVEQAREEFGKEIVNAKGQITDLDALNKALFSIMEERTSGAMERMTNTYTGAMNNFQDSISKLQASIGKELLPMLTELTKGIGSFIDGLNSLSPEMRGFAANTILTGTALTGGIGLLATAGARFMMVAESVSQAGIALKGFSAAASLGVVAGVGAAIIALAALTKSYIDLKQAQAELQEQDIQKRTNDYAEALKKVQDVLPNVASGQQAFNEIVKEGIQQLKEESDGLEKVIGTTKLLAEEKLKLVDALSEEVKHRDQVIEAINKFKEQGFPTEALEKELELSNKQIETYKESIKEKQAQIEKTYEMSTAIKDNTIAAGEQGNVIQDLSSKFMTFGQSIKQAAQDLTVIDLKSVTQDLKDLNDSLFVGDIDISQKKAAIEELLNSEKLADDARMTLRKELKTVNDEIYKQQEDANKKYIEDVEAQKKIEEEALKKKIEWGKELLAQKETEKVDATDYFNQQLQIIQDVDERRKGYLRTRLDLLKQVYEIEKSSGELSITDKELLDAEIALYEYELALLKQKAELAWAETETIRQKLLAHQEITIEEQKNLEEAINLKKEYIETKAATDKLKSNVSATASATAAANEEAKNLAASFGAAADEAGRAAAEMGKMSTGNITTGVGMDELGNYFADLPGTNWSPIGDATGGGNYGRQSYFTEGDVIGGPSQDLINSLNPGQSYRPNNTTTTNQEITINIDGQQAYNPRVQRASSDLISEINESYFT